VMTLIPVEPVMEIPVASGGRIDILEIGDIDGIAGRLIDIGQVDNDGPSPGKACFVPGAAVNRKFRSRDRRSCRCHRRQSAYRPRPHHR